MGSSSLNFLPNHIVMRKEPRKYVLAFHRWDGEVALLEKKQPFSFNAPDVDESFITYEEHGERELQIFKNRNQAESRMNHILESYHELRDGGVLLLDENPILSILLGAKVVASNCKSNDTTKTMKRLEVSDKSTKVVNWEEKI